MKEMHRKSEAARDEWIVQAKLPARHVEFTTSRGTGHAVPTGVSRSRGVGLDRDSSLRELLDYLRSILEVEPVLLRAAGAVSVTASPKELERIVTHPLVKRIDPNRRLKR